VDLDRPIVPDRTVDALVDDVLRVRKQCVEAVVAGDIVVLVLRLLDVPLVLVDPSKASSFGVTCGRLERNHAADRRLGDAVGDGIQRTGKRVRPGIVITECRDAAFDHLGGRSEGGESGITLRERFVNFPPDVDERFVETPGTRSAAPRIGSAYMCVWQFTRPGITTSSRASIVSPSDSYPSAMSAISPYSTTTWTSSDLARSSFIVMSVPAFSITPWEILSFYKKVPLVDFFVERSHMATHRCHKRVLGVAAFAEAPHTGK